MHGVIDFIRPRGKRHQTHPRLRSLRRAGSRWKKSRAAAPATFIIISVAREERNRLQNLIKLTTAAHLEVIITSRALTRKFLRRTRKA